MYQTVKNKLTQDLKAHDNQISFTSDPLPKRSVNMLISAPRGSGKTTLLKTLFDSKNGYKQHFHRIYWFSPTAIKDVEKLGDILEELIEDGRYFDKYAEEDLSGVLQEIADYNEKYNEKHKGSKKPNHAIVIDDCQSDLLNKKNKVLQHLITCSRHYGITMIMSCQRYVGIPMLIRSNCDVFIFFKVKSKMERKRISEEFDIPEEMLNICWDEPYSFITLNYANGQQEMYRKFDKIVN
jgi:DNA polymerase III delta prime subunit